VRQQGKNFSLVNIKMKSQSINTVKLNKKIGTPQNPKTLSQASDERMTLYAGNKNTLMNLQNKNGGHTLVSENEPLQNFQQPNKSNLNE